MANDHRSTMTRQRHERQEALREYLSERGKINYIFDNIEKLEKQYLELEASQIQALAKATEIRMKLVDKYLPSEKYLELQGQLDSRATVIRKDLSGNAND